MSPVTATKPLGVFDSGLGGLTVVRQLQQVFPNLPIIYYGDTARVPYGTKSPKTVTHFSRQIIDFLIAQDVQAIVVACNTASANAVPTLRNEYDIPIHGVIEPGALAAARSTKQKRIGIIGTVSTIRASSYSKALYALDPEIVTIGQPCPLFVPLVEEGLEEHLVTEIITAEYLEPLLDEQIDTLILGCTHYPLLKETLKKALPKDVVIIDSGVAAADGLSGILMVNSQEKPPYKYYVSDTPEKFAELGARFLGHSMEQVYYFDVDRPWTIDDIQSAPRIT